jgi:hypothetical protein
MNKFKFLMIFKDDLVNAALEKQFQCKTKRVSYKQDSLTQGTEKTRSLRIGDSQKASKKVINSDKKRAKKSNMKVK